MSRRRWLWITSLCFVGLAALLGRLFVVSVWPAGGHQLTFVRPAIAMDAEHFHVIQTDDGRGRILFRNGQPWSGTTRRAHLEAPDGSGIDWSIHQERAAERPDAVVGLVGLPDRWSDVQRSVPVQGRSGLEYRFDCFLSTGKPGFLAWLVDARGRAQRGWYERPGNSGLNLRTTVDAAWQTTADAILDQMGSPRAALVVVDVQTRDILAMASRDVHHPWLNHAVRPETPGSIFKLITAAAALESFRFQANSRFFCAGVVPLAGVKMHCWRRHGPETFTEALAESCDVAFALIGAAVGRTGVQRMAEQLGIRQTGLQTFRGRPVLPEAIRGQVFVRSGDDAGLLANTAIGQEDVRMSPLQAANLAATIGAGGVYRDARLAIDLETPDGVRTEFPMHPAVRSMSPGTAYVLRQAMRQAVENPAGTAHVLHDAAEPLAVKTGTAELPHAGRVNAWVVGLLPADRPRVAFAVAVLNAPETAAHRQVFTAVRKLAHWYRQFHGVCGIR
ncbi:MAG: hypothetical protein K6T63_00330 [Alicyclobacillus herbarius]|uniref:penicillin-binding transpeptidase domain-containing protein n=1 Tax=Alicyclobacillus herbarius TaxID=122960 RepID=UPI0023521D3D|nr:penicillin-binding transpeptidase domain-containing protein [Alicyclobacillus herbarius]MCL6631051.1 hypothetical protein [Alicyclobacillus herbarius]